MTLREIRKEKMTLTTLSLKTNMNISILSTIENHITIPKPDVLIKICRVLGINHEPILIEYGYIPDRIQDAIISRLRSEPDTLYKELGML